MESVLSRIEMSVGAIVGGTRVNGTGVSVGGREGLVGGGEVGVPVDKTSTEKIQALSKNAVNTKLPISRNHTDPLIAFSISVIESTTRCLQISQ